MNEHIGVLTNQHWAYISGASVLTNQHWAYTSDNYLTNQHPDYITNSVFN